MNTLCSSTKLWGVAVMFALQPPIFADVVYNLNSYPSEQNNGALSGSITVTDTASNDGSLTDAEILRWTWTAQDATAENTLSASSTDPGALGSVRGAIITPSDILLPAPGILALYAYPRGYPSPSP